MVGVAQLVEHQVVALVAEGSIPFAHPILSRFSRLKRLVNETRNSNPLSIGFFDFRLKPYKSIERGG